MNRFIQQYGPLLLTLLFGISVLLFWRLCYPFAMSYQEQCQLFLFDSQYFLDRVAVPGGLTRYVSEFLVQFYNNFWLGATVIALLLMLLQWLVWRLMRQAAGDLPAGGHTFCVWYPLSFLPSVMVWYVMGDENMTLMFPVALIVTAALMLLYQWLSRKGRWGRWMWLILIPIGYWIAGPAVLMLAVMTGMLMLIAVPYTLLLVAFCCFMVPYAFDVQMCGIGYYRNFAMMGVPMALIMLVIGLLPLLVRWLPKMKNDRQQLVTVAAQVAVLVLAVVAFVPRGFDARTYEVMEYDYLVRVNNWDGILAKADKKSPDLPMSVCATNLALAMKGELCERAFDYFQHGAEGLLPPFDRNFNAIPLTGEAYWQLGMVNTAQRFAFEAMEAIPNYCKSSRSVKRLAETNLVNGQYEVARKYLQMLEKTVFYRRWAQRTLQLLGNEQAINQHPLYGRQRQLRLKDDFMFSEREIDKIMGQLLMQNPQNTLAMQYLLMFPLLNRDINTFMNYMMYILQHHPNYRPRACQEAIALAYAQRRQQPPQGLVAPQVLQRYNDFMQAYRNHGPVELYRNTAWYYLLSNEK